MAVPSAFPLVGRGSRRAVPSEFRVPTSAFGRGIGHFTIIRHPHMSYLSTALQRQIEARRMNHADFARESGISKSFISRFMSGETRDLSDQSFQSILGVFDNDHQAQADLVVARCLDAKAGATGTPGADLVEIRTKTSSPAEPVGPPAVALPQETERAFAWLRSQCPLNPLLEKQLIGLAQMSGMQ